MTPRHGGPAQLWRGPASNPARCQASDEQVFEQFRAALLQQQRQQGPDCPTLRPNTVTEAIAAADSSAVRAQWLAARLHPCLASPSIDPDRKHTGMEWHRTPPYGRRDQAPFVLIVAITACGTLGMHLIIPALPDTARALGVSAGAIQLTITLYLIGLAIGQLLYARCPTGSVAGRCCWRGWHCSPWPASPRPRRRMPGPW